MSEGLITLAERLAGPTIAPWMERVRFVTSGSEATSTAIRIARGPTGRRKIVVDPARFGQAACFFAFAACTSALVNAGLSPTWDAGGGVIVTGSPNLEKV